MQPVITFTYLQSRLLACWLLFLLAVGCGFQRTTYRPGNELLEGEIAAAAQKLGGGGAADLQTRRRFSYATTPTPLGIPIDMDQRIRSTWTPVSWTAYMGQTHGELVAY
jgi:hypothetical protein